MGRGQPGRSSIPLAGPQESTVKSRSEVIPIVRIGTNYLNGSTSTTTTSKKERQRELEQRRWYVENGFGARCWFLREDGSIGIVLYPMCRFAKILHIPNNVKPDWLKAAVRALEVAETFRVTRIGRRWLKVARKRVEDLLRP